MKTSALRISDQCGHNRVTSIGCEIRFRQSTGGLKVVFTGVERVVVRALHSEL